ncbi:flagellar biosynthesis regulator FlaF [Aliiroseovarius sediminis]|uniref:flagellar biosynthesis regulator FlaF n=1 Tax=Aliiroseovarius sediminis TaxID=2925839 RepID=UPI001F59A1AD|nr:flagellar biosynthesis regulator FlaF [uncultured Aliiroseovarius sp.]MCI2394744.1 flagellar biosynthesis regulator FlaF [Aliiroseovarius sediminis]
MNAVAMAKTAYNSTSRAPLRTSRGTEYEAFAKVTHQLGRARTSSFADLAAALHENRRLWTLLAADVANEDNALPSDLRARLFYLAEFTADHSRKVLSEGEDASVLVEINTAVMRGLRQSEGTV